MIQGDRVERDMGESRLTVVLLPLMEYRTMNSSTVLPTTSKVLYTLRECILSMVRIKLIMVFLPYGTAEYCTRTYSCTS
jgi:hypothetical protein